MVGGWWLFSPEYGASCMEGFWVVGSGGLGLVWGFGGGFQAGAGGGLMVGQLQWRWINFLGLAGRVGPTANQSLRREQMAGTTQAAGVGSSGKGSALRWLLNLF